MPNTGSIDQSMVSLAGRFSGDLLGPDDEGYDTARKVHNGLVDKRPALIARCRTTSDVVSALSLARENGLEISVRGGGHNVSGRAVSDGGLMIDLSLMKAINVDPVARTARAEPGVTWHELNDATAEEGLATTGGVISSTGIAGLTLGGGLGWLMGKHGLAADNLISVEVVTARGDVLTASAQEHPDLFWALRGGGGNFGIATSFEYRLHPLRKVFGGLVAYSLADGAETLRFYREFIGTAPDELAVMGLLVHTPDGVPVTAFAICHAGDPALAEVDLKPFLEFGSPVMANTGQMSYPAVNSMLDGSFPAGVLNYWKSSFLKELSDEAIDVLLERFSSVPSPMTGIAIEHLHGAVTRIGVSDTAMPHRETGFNVLIASEWTDPQATQANIAWTRESYAAIEPFFSAGRYVNYLDKDDGDAVRSAYGPNYARLTELKRIYDPDNVFRLNLNIVPATSS